MGPGELFKTRQVPFVGKPLLRNSATFYSSTF